jgi:hypothetical protein
VGAAVRDGDRWRLADAAGGRLGEYDALVLALPAPLAAALIDPAAHRFASRLREVAMAPCWAVLAAFDAPLEVPWDAAFDAAGPLRWLCRDSSKPGRAPGERWVLHASAAWSERHLEEAPEAVARALLDAFAGSAGAPAPAPAALVAHRWRHAATLRPLGEDCLFAPETALAACGDWCLDGRLEGAFLSGVAAAGRLLGLPPTGPVEAAAPLPSARPAQLRLLD